MYTQSQLVTMAMEAPLFLDRLELISDGYKNGMARKDRPYGLVLVARIEIGGRCTHIEEVVKEDVSHCNSIRDVSSYSKSYRRDRKAHRTSCSSEEHQLIATDSFNDKVRHSCPEHPLHGVRRRQD